MRWAVLLVTATGCQQLLGLDKPHVIDAAGDDGDVFEDATPDVAPGSCVARWLANDPPLGAPEPVVGVNTTGTERFPFVVDVPGQTQLYMYFARDNDYFSARGSQASFGQVQAEPQLSSAMNDTKIFVNDDRTRAFFASNRSGGSGGYDLWRGFRQDVTDTWAVDQMYLGAINDANGQSDPHLSSGLLRIYFTDGSASTDQRLGTAFRGSVSQAFGAPIFSASLETAFDEADPALTENELVIVFTSNRTGNSELYYATRTSILADFTAPTALSVVNDPNASENTPFLTKDGCRLYFTSERGGNADIYTSGND